MSAAGIVDITAPLSESLVTWPGVVERFERSVVASLDTGDAMTVSAFSLGAHAGTHIDAPNHFIAGAGGVETIPLTALIGPGVVIEVPATVDIVTDEFLAASVPTTTERLLLKTRNSGWSRSATSFDTSYVACDATAAEWCVQAGIRLLGIDYLSVEPYDADADSYPTHTTLLDAGIVVLESVDLAGVDPGRYTFVVLPLLVPGSDGAPTRALLVPRGSELSIP